MSWFIKYNLKNSIRLLLVSALLSLTLAACNGNGSCNGNSNTDSNGDASTLQIITPKTIYGSSSGTSVGYVTINNPTDVAVKNLHYSLTQTVGSGSGLTIEPSSAANCIIIAAHSKCNVKLLVPSGSIAGSTGFIAENKSTTQDKSVQSSDASGMTMGIEQAAYNQLDAADGLTVSYFHTVISGTPYVLVNGVVASAKAGNFNNIALTDDKGNPLPNQQLVSGSVSNTQGSTFSILLPVAATSGISQVIRLQTQQVSSDGSVTVLSTSTTSSTLTTASNIGIVNMLPNAVYLTSNNPQQTITLANSGDTGAVLQSLISSSSNIEVSFTSGTLGSGETITATFKLKNPNVTASASSITLSYNNSVEEIKDSVVVGENVNPAPSPTPSPSPSPTPPTPGLITSLSPDSNFYTTTAIGSVSRIMTIHNSGSTTENNFVFTLPNNDFSIASSGSSASDCSVDSGTKTVSNSLNSGSECNLIVTYTKNSVIAQTTGDISVTYNYNAGVPAPAPAVLSVSYRVTQSTANLSLSPTSIIYNNIINNNIESSTATLTLTNSGDLPAAVLNIQVNPNPSAVFAVTGGSANCTNGATLPAGASCDIYTKFGPSAATAGTYSGTLSASDGGGLALSSSALSGTLLTDQSANISQGAFSGQNFAGGTGASVPAAFQIEQGSGSPYPYVSVIISNSATTTANNFYIDGVSSSYWALGGNCGTSGSPVTLGARGSGSESCTATFTMTSAALNSPAGPQNLDLSNYTLYWNDLAHPSTPTSQNLTGIAYVNLYEAASITVTSSPGSNIIIAPGGSFTMTATLSGGYQVAAQTIHATTSNGDINFTNNDCALNSQNSYTCMIRAVATSNATSISGQTVTLSNTTTPDMTPSPDTVNFAITSAIVQIALPQTGQLLRVPNGCSPLSATCIDSIAGSDGYGRTTLNGSNIPFGVPWVYNGSASLNPVIRFTSGTAVGGGACTSGEEVVNDNLTGLMWVKSPSSTTYAWDDGNGNYPALAAVAAMNQSGYCGYTDWRLPNINELMSMVNAGESNPSIWLNNPSQGFSNIKEWYYWSSTTAANLTTSALAIQFTTGNISSLAKATSSNILPVRGTTTAPALIPQTGQIISYAAGDDGALQTGESGTNAANRFLPGSKSDGSSCQTGENVRVDRQTGLMWIESPTAVTYTWNNAMSAVPASYCGYTDWRIPNRNEMRSLINYGQNTSASWLNDSAQGFHNITTSGGGYWTSTTSASVPANAWTIGMNSGTVSGFGKTSPLRNVWSVRGGQ